MSRMPKIMIIGLDGGTFALIKPWIDEGKLPNIAGLMQTGAYSNLKSTLPPMTFPAWNAFMTGQNPGKHGVFDFMERKHGSYELAIMNARHRKCKTIWKIASSYGKRCAVIGVPVTYPPEDINGVMISGFDAPFHDERIMHPPELYRELERNVGEYIVSASFTKHIRTGHIDRALDALFMAIDRKADTAKYLLEREEWDLFMIVFGETDAAMHHLWKYHDMSSPQRSCSEAYCSVDPLLEVYKRIDDHIGGLLKLTDNKTTVIIMSDHGAGGSGVKFIYPNRYLETQGLLKFRSLPYKTQTVRTLERLKAWVRIVLPKRMVKRLRFNPKGMGLKMESRLRFSGIDWSGTMVYAEETPYYPNFKVNLRGREPDGIVGEGEYNEVVERTISALNEWTDPETGERVVNKAYRREDIYHGDNLDKAPDIIISWNLDKGYSYLSRPSLMSREGLPIERLDMREKGMSDYMINRSGSHRDEGVFIISGRGINMDMAVDGDVNIIDIAPTILSLLGIPVPEAMDGKVLVSSREYAASSASGIDAASESEPAYQYNDEETDEIRKRLEGLGYL